MVKRTRRGMTLVEVMIVSAIIGLMALFSYRLMMQSIVFVRMNRARLETTRDARNAMKMIVDKLRQASAASVVLDELTGQAPYSRITFSVGVNQYQFWQNGSSLMISKDAAVQKVSDNLRSLIFSYPDLKKPNLIAVSITMEQRLFSNRAEMKKQMRLAIEKVRIMNP